jgi:hypothetical protein
VPSGALRGTAATLIINEGAPFILIEPGSRPVTGPTSISRRSRSGAARDEARRIAVNIAKLPELLASR